MVRAFSVGTNDMTLALYLGNILRTTIALHDLINTKIPPVLPITIHLDSFNSVGHLSSSMISFLSYVCVFVFYRSRSVYLYNRVCEAVCLALSTEVEESTKKDKKEETKDGKENEDKDKAKGKEKEEKTDDTKDSKGK